MMVLSRGLVYDAPRLRAAAAAATIAAFTDAGVPVTPSIGDRGGGDT